ncbi:M24 family metallopeptidase [Candidatus Pelagibacter sp. HIMB109]|uniref:M24 family metallopeptidase n=1 Tax=Candidatus Pelagibacter sp. HIMB109 TaxID=3415412 RepID=UPI003F84CC58
MNSVLKIKNYLKNNNNIEACLISKNNTFLNEFVEDRDNFLLKITKFTGSLGYAIIYKNKQNLYVDGRYTQQAKIQTKNFIIKDISLLKNDIGKIINSNKKLLIDPKTFTFNFFGKFNYRNLHFFNSNKNLKKKEKLFYLSKNYSGQDSFEKSKKVNKKLTLKKNEVFLITSPENIAWLSNIRSYDKKFSKIFNCIALIKNKKIYIYSDQKINLKIKNIIFKKNSEFKQHLLSIKKIYTDKKYLSLYHHNFFIKNKIKIKFINDPIDQFKSIKNNTEILNLKISHIFDGIAYCKFLYWLKNNNLKNTSEIECQKKIEFFKKKNKFYLGPSFETISATEKNASIIHYNAKDYKKTNLKKKHLYLLDSGSQYLYGTTDMTRSFSLGKQNQFRKKIYTLVLKSHITVAIANLKNMTGKKLDRIARKNLLKFGYNYNHGTGHGVGFLSNVHEAPPSISKFYNKKFLVNQVVSNEPGYYKNNDFGIRIENLIYKNHKNNFENLTLVPFEREMILKSMLTKNEKDWINNYHKEIFEKIHKFLNSKQKVFLQKYCSRIN